MDFMPDFLSGSAHMNGQVKSKQKSVKAPGTGKEASTAGRIMSAAKKPDLDASHRDRNGSEAALLRQADKMLTRIERRGKALSASADKLLRRVS
jgi:hypothetical protein